MDTMNFSSYIHTLLRINYNNFDDPLTFHVVPSSGLNFGGLKKKTVFAQGSALYHVSFVA